jgi:hypothetical protein
MCGLILASGVLLASTAHTAEEHTIDTSGFSITLPKNWRYVSTNHKDTILASPFGEERPPFIMIYYADKPVSANESELQEYEKFNNSSISDIMRERGQKILQESTWDSADTVQEPNGITEERLDLEGVGTDERTGKSLDVCAFVRFFHNAPHAAVYLALLENTPCKQARPELESLTASIVWK